MYPLHYRIATAHEEGEYTITGDESADEIEALGLATKDTRHHTWATAPTPSTPSPSTAKDGHVTSLRGNEVEVVNGRRQPMKDTDFELDADLVLIALGFQGAERGGLIHEFGVSFDQRGRMVRDNEYRAETKPLFPWFQATRLHRRRQRPRPIPDRLGYRRGPRRRRCRRPRPHGRIRPAHPSHPTHQPTDRLVTRRQKPTTAKDQHNPNRTKKEARSPRCALPLSASSSAQKETRTTLRELPPPGHQTMGADALDVTCTPGAPA